MDDTAAVSASASRVSVCGVYQCDDNFVSRNQIDLRTDGTCQFFIRTTNAGEMKSGQPVVWRMEGSAVIIGKQIFTVERFDLIDARGNRWERVR